VFAYTNRRILTYNGTIPRVKDVTVDWQMSTDNYTYLFTISDVAFYLLLERLPERVNAKYVDVLTLRELEPKYLAFGSATAAQLGEWYATNQYCGQCGQPMVSMTTERTLVCPNCHHREYPKISPAIIVGVTKGDQILMTKFATGYDRYALISGYAEIGETLEDTVQREVKEEVGLAVHHIRYYGSQPWGFSGALLVGFFAELDNDMPIKLEHDELSQAKWFQRDSIPRDDTTLSLSWQMIEDFRQRRI